MPSNTTIYWLLAPALKPQGNRHGTPRSAATRLAFTAPKIPEQKEKERLGTRIKLTLRLNYENYGNCYLFATTIPKKMNQPLLLTLLAVSTYFYFHNSASPTSAQTGRNVVATQNWAIAPAPSSYNRWKTGPDAQTDLKTGPNAQTEFKMGPNAQTAFEPFAPNEQATWNQTPGYTIVSGRRVN